MFNNQTMNLSYREINSSEAEQIFLAGKSDFGSSSQYSWDWSIDKIKEYCQEDFGTGIVCLEKDKLVGFALAQNKYSEQKPDVAWFTYVWVHSDYQRKGIASALFNKVEAVLKKKGSKEILTDIYENNKSSLKFFEKENFTIKEKWFILTKKIK